ncbi:hypothetical protein SAMN04515674_101603 [Pseudarcicella hirudinis]|uniref:Uncharacterized protein n=1 Tax=Pseudarcicella hirudinis TaxID=1079859 RepID=A0A1I5N5E9_9BACT|nr:contractile injection system tape measure protein [Pseudarcicella hirudinis]SFP16832.1 hypothetical protein SAMN04515674_101603 [Pseudarcicella hirudinis]
MHQIQKQIIEMELPDGADVLNWQEKIVAICNDSLASQMSRLFDEISPETQMSMDRIYLDLGIIDGDDFEEKLLKMVESQLSAFLKKEYSIQNKRKNPSQKTFLQKSFPQNGSADFSKFGSFLFFLENGTVGWWTSSGFLSEVENHWAEVLSPDLSERKQQIMLLKKVLIKPIPMTRIINQFSVDFLWKVINDLIENAGVKIEALQKAVAIFEESLGQVLKKSTVFDIKTEVLNQIIESVLLDKSLIVSDLYGIFSESILKKRLLSQTESTTFLEVLAQDFKENFAEKTEGLNTEKYKKAALGFEEKAGDYKVGKSEEIESRKTSQSKEIYIENAGLVILYPFLKEYLKACEVADDEKILKVNEAVHLLQYLVTSQLETSENELVLNKILCGLPLDFPVKKAFGITPEQQQHGENLLDAVIRYWTVMKNTSREGLQLSFLRRNGKLSRQPDGWLLQIEQAPYDMLLEELPWGYSVVSLPYMKEMIFVE